MYQVRHSASLRMLIAKPAEPAIVLQEPWAVPLDRPPTSMHNTGPAPQDPTCLLEHLRLAPMNGCSPARATFLLSGSTSDVHTHETLESSWDERPSWNCSTWILARPGTVIPHKLHKRYPLAFASVVILRVPCSLYFMLPCGCSSFSVCSVLLMRFPWS